MKGEECGETLTAFSFPFPIPHYFLLTVHISWRIRIYERGYTGEVE